MSNFSIKIVTRPEIKIAGLHIRTDMQNAKNDCPKLWQEDFGPRMCEIAPCGRSESYGASWLVDYTTGSFDYWAAMPLPQGTPAPQGMNTATLPGGLYVECTVDSLQSLPAAYQYVYSNWLPSQKDYSASHNLPCYELYPADFMQSKKLFLYFALIKN